MEAVGKAEAQFFGFGVRAVFEIVDAGQLGFRGAFFLRGDGVSADGVFGLAEDGDADGDQLFVPAGERAIAEEGLQEAGDAFGDVRRVGQGFEHVGDNATLGEEGVVDDGGGGSDGVAFE